MKRRWGLILRMNLISAEKMTKMNQVKVLHRLAQNSRMKKSRSRMMMKKNLWTFSQTFLD
jgi:hypothetical protein